VPYPGDEVRFYTRIQAQRALPGWSLRISFPEGLRPGSTQAPGGAIPRLSLEGEATVLIWEVDGLEARETFEAQVLAEIEPTHDDIVLKSRATVALGEQNQDASTSATASLSVLAKAKTLRHLPSLYERDELMGRFLMLFESFWTPFERRIEHLPYYFDPKMTPPDFLPWLASWLGVALAEHLSEAQRRRLIQSALELYRRRGTRRGLQTYLEILGEQAQIIEHRATSFRLGGEARLGPGIALGQSARPHTFTVIVRSPEGPSRGETAEDAYREQLRRQTIRAAIDAEKPAHTAYVLRFEPRA
jgi:phage tail-like protein